MGRYIFYSYKIILKTNKYFNILKLKIYTKSMKTSWSQNLQHLGHSILVQVQF